MRRNIVIGSTAAVIGGIALVGVALTRDAFAEGPRDHRGFGGPGFMLSDAFVERAIVALELDDGQRTTVRAIVDEARPDLRAFADEMRESRTELMGLVEAETLDEAALRAFADARSETVADAIVIGGTVMHEIRAILTPEQLERLEELREHRGGRRGFRR